MSNPAKRQLKEQTTMGAPSVSAGGHIDLALGTFDRPGPNPAKDAEKAIVPREQVATQLATDRPPVEDSDYVPNSIVELAKAVAELAKLVPPEQVKTFYLRAKELTDNCVERQEIATDGETNVQESKKSKIVKMINEALDDMEAMNEPENDIVQKGRKLTPYPDIIKAHPEEFEDIAPRRRYAAALRAAQMGAGKLQAILDQIPEEKLDKIQNIAKDEYIDLFEELLGDDADPDEIADLKKLPPHVLYDMSDAYKFFYKAAFVLPAQNEFDKEYKKTVRDAIADTQAKLKPLKVPASALSTTVFQLLGFSKRNPQEIKQKYADAASAGEIRTNEIEMLYKLLMSKYADIEATSKKKMADARAQAADVFIDESLNLYSKMSLQQKKNLMLQAFDKMG